jgi:hypothetical protein
MKTNSLNGSLHKPAYKLEELLALRGSVSESTVSLEKFGDEAAIKGKVSLSFLSFILGGLVAIKPLWLSTPLSYSEFQLGFIPPAFWSLLILAFISPISVIFSLAESIHYLLAPLGEAEAVTFIQDSNLITHHELKLT